MKLRKQIKTLSIVTLVVLLLLIPQIKNVPTNATEITTGAISVIGQNAGYPTLASAVNAAQTGSVLQLNMDITETVTVTKNITLDLNGHCVDGTVTVKNGSTLIIKDTSTDDFTTADGYGKIKTQGVVQAAEGYIAIQEEDGTSYHRLDLEINYVTLRPSVAGIYYSSNFGGDELIRDQICYYGTALSLYDVATAEDILSDDYRGGHTAFSNSSWVCAEKGKANGTLLTNILLPSNSLEENITNSNIDIYGVSYIQLKSGEIVFGQPITVNLRQIVEVIDTFYNTLTPKKADALKAMYLTYKNTMADWNIPNLAADTTGPLLYGEKVNASAGDSVAVSVSVKENPGILGMLLSVEYDENVLTLTDASNGDATVALTYQNPSRYNSGCNFVWYGAETGEIKDGTVLNLVFHVADNAAAGKYPVKITCSNADTYDANYNPITATVADGVVIVDDSSSQTPVMHTVVFKDYDGTVLSTQIVEDGKAAIAPANPVRSGYEFTGWDKAFNNVTSDLVVTAQYEQETTGPKLYGSKEEVSAGDTVIVTVSVKNNPGILGMLLTAKYNENILTLTGTANGTATSALTYQEPSRLISGANYLWYGSKTGTVTDGSVLTLTFKVADKAPAGTYPIELICSSQDTYDGNGNPITATIVNGAITVLGQPAVVTHTVVFKDYDGTVLSTQIVEDGKAATAPADPVRSGYEFTGWDKAFNNVTSDLVVTAQYEQEATGPKFYISKETASAGSTVTVTVSVKNNPGILGLLLAIEYDESVLTLTGTANGSAVSALTYLEPSRLVSGANYLWYGSKTGTVTDGSLLKLTFKVADGTSAGTYHIRLTYSSPDTYDGSYNSIIATVADGAVVVG